MRGDGAIWLIGMMGAGKSTVGPVLAQALERPFCDTDEAICERAGRTIPEIFERDGEPGFRALEREVIEAAMEVLNESTAPIAAQLMNEVLRVTVRGRTVDEVLEGEARTSARDIRLT